MPLTPTAKTWPLECLSSSLRSSSRWSQPFKQLKSIWQGVNHLTFWNWQHPRYPAEDLEPYLLDLWRLLGIDATVAKTQFYLLCPCTLSTVRFTEAFFPQLPMKLGSSRCTSFVVVWCVKSKDFCSVHWKIKKTKLIKTSTSCVCHYDEYDPSWSKIKNITSSSFLLPRKKKQNKTSLPIAFVTRKHTFEYTMNN